MTTLGDLAAVTTAPDTGATIVRVRDHGYKILGGAALYDLVDRGRLGRTGEGRQARVIVTDPTPVPEPSLEYGLSRVRNHPEQWPRNAVLRLGGGTKLREGIYGGLATEGVLGPREKAGLFSSRYPVLDLQRRDQLIGQVHAALLGGQDPDEPTRRLAALLAIGDDHTGPLLDIVIDWPGAGTPPTGAARRDAKARAEQRAAQLFTTDWVAATTLYSILLPLKLASVGVKLGIADALIPR